MLKACENSSTGHSETGLVHILEKMGNEVEEWVGKRGPRSLRSVKLKGSHLTAANLSGRM